jgi:hypothetical protein
MDSDKVGSSNAPKRKHSAVHTNTEPLSVQEETAHFIAKIQASNPLVVSQATEIQALKNQLAESVKERENQRLAFEAKTSTSHLLMRGEDEAAIRTLNLEVNSLKGQIAIYQQLESSKATWEGKEEKYKAVWRDDKRKNKEEMRRGRSQWKAEKAKLKAKKAKWKAEKDKEKALAKKDLDDLLRGWTASKLGQTKVAQPFGTSIASLYANKFS